MSRDFGSYTPLVSLGGRGGAMTLDIPIGRCDATHDFHRVKPSDVDQLTESFRRP